MVCNLPAASATAQLCSCYPLLVSWKQRCFPWEELGIQLAHHFKKTRLPTSCVYLCSCLICSIAWGFPRADRVCGHPLCFSRSPTQAGSLHTSHGPAWFAPACLAPSQSRVGSLLFAVPPRLSACWR